MASYNTFLYGNYQHYIQPSPHKLYLLHMLKELNITKTTMQRNLNRKCLQEKITAKDSVLTLFDGSHRNIFIKRK